MKLNILVTGGSGRIGRPLVNKLAGLGHSVQVFDRKETSWIQGISTIIADVNDAGSWQGLKGPFDSIIHLAEESNREDSFNDVIAFHETNVSGTVKMLEYARKNNVRHVIIASSTSVANQDGVYNRVPKSPYEATKIAAERFAQVHSALHELAVTVTRWNVVDGHCQEIADAIAELVPTGAGFRIAQV